MIEALLLFLPAYVANAIPVLLGGSLPIDSLLGRHTFGKNKTLLGLLSGFSAGTLTSAAVAPFVPLPYKEAFALGILASAGAMVGDLIGSYIKRQFRMKEGSEFLLDHIFFAMVAFSFVYVMNPALFTPFEALLFFTITFFIHRGANILAFHAGLKKVPW